MLLTNGSLLRIFVGENDRHENRPLYEWIVAQAKAEGLAGVTVLRGLMGFGTNTRVIHTFRFECLSQDLPVIIELIDTSEKLDAFISRIEPHIHSGLLVNRSQVQIRFSRANQSSLLPIPSV